MVLFRASYFAELCLGDVTFQNFEGRPAARSTMILFPARLDNYCQGSLYLPLNTTLSRADDHYSMVKPTPQ